MVLVKVSNNNFLCCSPCLSVHIFPHLFCRKTRKHSVRTNMGTRRGEEKTDRKAAMNEKKRRKEWIGSSFILLFFLLCCCVLCATDSQHHFPSTTSSSSSFDQTVHLLPFFQFCSCLRRNTHEFVSNFNGSVLFYAVQQQQKNCRGLPDICKGVSRTDKDGVWQIQIRNSSSRKSMRKMNITTMLRKITAAKSM